MPGYSGEFICIILISCIPCDGCIYIDGVCPEDEGRKEWYSFSFVNYSVSIIQLELASASLFLQVRASKTDCLEVRLRLRLVSRLLRCYLKLTRFGPILCSILGLIRLFQQLLVIGCRKGQ
jgi:hypothetical protein